MGALQNNYSLNEGGKGVSVCDIILINAACQAVPLLVINSNMSVSVFPSIKEKLF